VQGSGAPEHRAVLAARHGAFMILGDVCTRRCGFCDVKTGKADPE